MTDQSDAARNPLCVKSAIISSASGWYLRQIANAAEGLFTPYIHVGAVHPKEPRNKTEDELYEVQMGFGEMFDDLPVVDVREDVPAQLVKYFRALAARFSHVANAIQKVPTEEYRHYPRAYITRNAAGEVVNAAMTISEALTFAGEHRGATITTEPLNDWPELLDAAQQWMEMAESDE